MLNQFTFKIQLYKGHFIVKVNNTPKLQKVGNGMMLIDYNDSDVLISYEAIQELKKSKGNVQESPAIEVVNRQTIWIAGYGSIIIPADEIINIYEIPNCTLTDNNIDDNIRKFLDE